MSVASNLIQLVEEYDAQEREPEPHKDKLRHELSEPLELDGVRVLPFLWVDGSVEIWVQRKGEDEQVVIFSPEDMLREPSEWFMSDFRPHGTAKYRVKRLMVHLFSMHYRLIRTDGKLLLVTTSAEGGVREPGERRAPLTVFVVQKE